MEQLQNPLCKTVVKYTSLSLLALGLSGCVVEHHPHHRAPQRPVAVIHKAPRPVVVHKPALKPVRPAAKPAPKAQRNVRKPAPQRPAHGKPAGKTAPGKPMPGPRR